MNDLIGYKGKRVFVTGCHSGIGEATARLLIEQGAEVHGTDHRDSVLPLASFTAADLRDPIAIDRLADGLRGDFDALFNCAGLPATADPVDVMKVNFLGLRHLTDRVSGRMRTGSAIASTASRAGMGWARRMEECQALIATEDFASGLDWCRANESVVGNGYLFSKETLIVWTMARAADFIRRGIRVNCTVPGSTQTPMLERLERESSPAALEVALQPIGRRSTSEEQALPLLFLNSTMASYINGAALIADGGFMASRMTAPPRDGLDPDGDDGAR